MGLFSSSKSSNTQNTYNTDKRVVSDGGSVGLSGDGSTVNVLDGGAIGRAFDAFETVQDGAGAGISALLQSAERLFMGAQAGTAKTQELATQMAGTLERNVLEAYSNAASDKTSTIDNRTVVVLGVAVALVVAVFAWKGGK